MIQFTNNNERDTIKDLCQFWSCLQLGHTDPSPSSNILPSAFLQLHLFSTDHQRHYCMLPYGSMRGFWDIFKFCNVTITYTKIFYVDLCDRSIKTATNSCAMEGKGLKVLKGLHKNSEKVWHGFVFSPLNQDFSTSVSIYTFKPSWYVALLYFLFAHFSLQYRLATHIFKWN